MHISQIRQQLKEVPIFKELSPEELDPIVEIVQPRFFKNKMYAFMQGDPLDRVFFIYSGKVKIYKTDSSGREQIVSVLETGEMFPHAGFFRKGQYPAHAEIMEDTQMIIVPISKFEEILVAYPELSIKLIRYLARKSSTCKQDSRSRFFIIRTNRSSCCCYVFARLMEKKENMDLN
ncbi:transcriptional regulator [Mesobacillus boroniphilus JCM 21738]|uniref:Transcriptional regulator n=1 Tax=Mesobacillus boroniphilus JCM 21738 TaxID=1294265 RepID=W4RGJ2_9BACI|nr:transcriptional regulator [Mesobacillus boroniphilus JCM 21738]